MSLKITKKEDIHALLSGFGKLKVMIVGDVMVDAYVFGNVDRISPEAPVPVVAVKDRANRLGGAANVALNIHALGAEPLMVTVIGNDRMGEEFIHLLEQRKLPTDGIIKSKGRITTTKFRIIGNKVQMLRVDDETLEDISSAEEQALIERVTSLLKSDRIDVMILQDYNKGVLTDEVIKRVIALAKQHHIPVAVDPKRKHFMAYQGVDLFKPNLKELKEGISIAFDSSDMESVKKAVLELRNSLDAKQVMVTLSERGVLITDQNPDNKDAVHHISAHLRRIADVSGAGDTVVSVASLCLAQQLDTVWLAELSNLAGGLVCEHIGVVPLDRNNFISEALKVFDKSSLGHKQ